MRNVDILWWKCRFFKDFLEIKFFEKIEKLKKMLATSLQNDEKCKVYEFQMHKTFYDEILDFSNPKFLGKIKKRNFELK